WLARFVGGDADPESLPHPAAAKAPEGTASADRPEPGDGLAHLTEEVAVVHGSFERFLDDLLSLGGTQHQRGGSVEEGLRPFIQRRPACVGIGRAVHRACLITDHTLLTHEQLRFGHARPARGPLGYRSEAAIMGAPHASS